MIPYEKCFSLSSFQASKHYFSYEVDLHLYNPVVCNMVSKQYLASTYHSDEDSDSEEEYASDQEEEEHDSNSEEENGAYEIAFSSFGSDLDIVTPVIPIKPTIDGSTIQIGEIACYLYRESDLVRNLGLLDTEVKAKEKPQEHIADGRTFIHNSAMRRRASPSSYNSLRVSASPGIAPPPRWRIIPSVSEISFAPLFSVSSTTDFIFFMQDSVPLCFKKILFDLHLILNSILQGIKNTIVNGAIEGDDGSDELLYNRPRPLTPVEERIHVPLPTCSSLPLSSVVAPARSPAAV